MHVAIPALSCGVFGYPVQEAAEVSSPDIVPNNTANILPNNRPSGVFGYDMGVGIPRKRPAVLSNAAKRRSFAVGTVAAAWLDGAHDEGIARRCRTLARVATQRRWLHK